MDFDLKGFVRALAPTVGAALGGPLGASVLGGLSQIILGKPDGTETDIAAAVASGAMTGAQISELKKMEMQLKAEEAERGFKYADLEFQRDKLYVQDVQDARHRQIETKDIMPQVILFIFLSIYVIEVAMFFFGKMPTDEYVRALMTRAFGTVEAGVVGAVAYFIGSSRGSKNSGDAIRRIAETPPAPAVTVVQGDQK